MRIAVMAAGGVGGYFGAKLAQAGHEVAFVARGRHLGVGAIQQRHQRERRVVALAQAGLEDAQVPAVALGVAGPEVVEELRDDAAVAQPIEGEAAIGERGVLAERDHRLGDAAQLLRLGQRGADLLVPQQ